MRFVLPTTYARTRIYRPKKESVPLATPAAADVSEVQVCADDGLRLSGWHCLSRSTREGPRPLILYFSGASGHRGHRLLEIEVFANLGCDILLVDYRGYGDNGGQPSERRIARDARTLWRFAVDELAVPAEQIVLFGESLGGAVAIRLASELCRKKTVPGGLILRATFACMLDVASRFFPRFFTNIFLVDRYRSAHCIRRVTCPVLSIHGTRDRMIPIEMGRRLFAAAPQSSANSVPKKFLELPGVGHNDLLEERRGEVETAITSFLDAAMPVEATVDAQSTSESVVVQPLL